MNLQNGTATMAAANPVLLRMIDLEMTRLVESWRFEGDAVHILLTLPARGCVCRVEHCWFVNRDGRTRCWECDAAYIKERDAKIAAMPIAREAVNA